MKPRRPMKRMSDKRRASQQYTKYDPVYARVDQRSEGRCEVVLTDGDGREWRCTARQRDHHHTLGRGTSPDPVTGLIPHSVQAVMAICRNHHDLEEAGKLETLPNGDETFACRMLA